MKPTLGAILSVGLMATIISGCACRQEVPDPPNPIDRLTILFIAKQPQIAALQGEARIPTDCREQKPDGKAEYEAKLSSSQPRETAYVCDKTTPATLAKFGEIYFDMTHGKLGTSVGSLSRSVETASLEPVFVSTANTPTGATMVTTTTTGCVWATCKWTGVSKYWKPGGTCTYPCN